MGTHSCEVAVVTCIDFRLQEYIDNWIKQKFGTKNHDRIAWAGGVKSLDLILGQVEISYKLHHIKEAVLINHEDCGAYGEESTPEKHAEDLKNAKAKILEKFPNVEVETYYLHLDGTFESVS